MSLAPIVLFVYNRPDHTLRTLNALSDNDLSEGSILYIYADGPKVEASKELLARISETRSVIKSKRWCKEVVIYESESNLGLANSIIKGVTEVVNRHNKVIVLEDDIVTSKGFLKYMNDALNAYDSDERVMHVSGYTYPCDFITDNEDSFFLRAFSCWGWATWKRAWTKYEHDLDRLLQNIKSRRDIKKFNIEGHADYFEQLLQNKRGEIYTWAVRWYASWLFSGGYSLLPRKSLVQNIGFDKSGVHCEGPDIYHTSVADYISIVKREVAEEQHNRNVLDAFYAEHNTLAKQTFQRVKMKIIKVLQIFGIFTISRNIFRRVKASYRS